LYHHLVIKQVDH